MVFGIGKKKTPDVKTADREGQRTVKKGTRDIDKEIRDLEREEAKALAEAKKYAAKNQMNAARTLAKSVANYREQRDKLIAYKANLQSLSSKMTVVKANHTVGTAIGNAGTAMQQINQATNVKETMKTMNNFSRQNEITAFQEEQVTDALASVFDNDGIEEESDFIVNQVLTELNIENTAGLESAPTYNPNASRTAVSTQNGYQPTGDPELDRLLMSL